MGGNIFIETHEVDVLGLPLPVQHLYLVQRDTNGEEYVIRSGAADGLWPFGRDMEIETNVPIDDSADARGGDTPAERGSTELTFAGSTTDETWSLMVRYSRMIDDSGYDYWPLGTNSNAFVGAMIAAAGGDPYAMLPTGISASDAVGLSSYDEIVADVDPPPDGTVYGSGAGELIASIQVDEVIRALGGNDTVGAGRGNDLVFGNRGADTLLGEAGNDTLRGARGTDRLEGGEGRNVLIGGLGPDAFVFGPAGSSSRVRDFEDESDQLVVIADRGTGFDDLEIFGYGSRDHHTIVAFDGSEMDLRNVAATRIGAEDVVFETPDALLA